MTEHEAATKALQLLATRNEILLKARRDNKQAYDRWLEAYRTAMRAEEALREHGPCPGFWAEVLHAARVETGQEDLATHKDTARNAWVVTRWVWDKQSGCWIRDVYSAYFQTEGEAVTTALETALRRKEKTS